MENDMNALPTSRRSVLAALAGALACPVLARSEQPPVAAAKFRAIEVDTSGVAESGDATAARWVAEVLPGDLRRSFARYLAPGDPRAPILLARIDLVTLGTEGSGGGSPNSTQAVDYIQGAGVVIGPGRRPIASYPFFTAVHSIPAEIAGNGVSGRTRIENLALSFANFLPGKMGLQ
jgi:hypothetical protein